MTGASDSLPTGSAPAQETSGPAATTPCSATDLKALLWELESIALGLRQQTAESENGVGPGEARLLQCLNEHGDLTVPDLARVRGTSRQNIQIMANRLAGEGCVEFNSNPAHKRSVLVRLTEQGRERLRRADERERNLEAELATALAQPELNQALELLQRIRRALSAGHPSGVNVAEPEAVSPPRPGKSWQRSAGVEEPVAAGSESTPGLSDNPNEFGLPANLL